VLIKFGIERCHCGKEWCSFLYRSLRFPEGGVPGGKCRLGRVRNAENLDCTKGMNGGEKK